MIVLSILKKFQKFCLKILRNFSKILRDLKLHSGRHLNTLLMVSQLLLSSPRGLCIGVGLILLSLEGLKIILK